ncbi:hypothetical protein CVT25_011990 [Psilocybe cyanescens]|uniref:Uncharacterized protein n=1 Tax=Psilocybe cyanescens TaxID=93625 RepID=A0A409XCJ9_PSICY|nr:hypothetical protein CVT25_011990 [Psilocybe cyanescens]
MHFDLKMFLIRRSQVPVFNPCGRSRAEAYTTNKGLGHADERSSDLALMVRNLHIIVDSKRVILRAATNLHGLLKVLSHRAQKLSILRIHGHISFSWTTIPQETADGLQALCRLLPVNRLSFHYVYDIPFTIVSVQEGPHVRYINFKNSKFRKIEADMAAGSNMLPANVKSGNLDLLGSLPTSGIYEICYTSDGRTRIVGMDIIILLFSDSQRLNQLLCDERVRSSLRYCHCTFSDIHEPLLTTTAIDFGTMILLRQLSIELHIGLYQRIETTMDAITSEMRVDLYQRYEDITNAIQTLIDYLYYGNAKSALQEIKVTLNVGHVLYKGTSMFDSVDFGSLQRLKTDSLRQKHPLIQSTQFFMNIGLVPRNSGPPQVQSPVEEIVRKLITDAITLPPIDEFLLPKIHICVERED